MVPVLLMVCTTAFIADIVEICCVFFHHLFPFYKSCHFYNSDFTFFGGIIVASVYHFATVVHDPAFAAILGAFPLTILCCYIIHDPVLLKEYVTLSVLGLTFELL